MSPLLHPIGALFQKNTRMVTERDKSFCDDLLSRTICDTSTATEKVLKSKITTNLSVSQLCGKEKVFVYQFLSVFGSI